MVLIDGKKLRDELVKKLSDIVSEQEQKPLLALVVVGNHPATDQFVRQKEILANKVGITVERRNFLDTVSTEELLECVRELTLRQDVNGIVVQLPLPAQINAQLVLDSIPEAKDVDVLGTNAIAKVRTGEFPILPPVAAAIQHIFENHHVEIAGKDVLVLGYGKLVGIPVSLYFRHNDAHVTVIDKPIADLDSYTRVADIIVSGVGKPRFITPTMVQPGVVLVDAGSSEQFGEIVGDIDPACAEVASLMTPTPGGVGPLTVVMLLRNCVILQRAHVGI